MVSKESGSAQPIAPGKACANPNGQQNMLEVCVDTAQQLLQVAVEERQLLEKFQAEALLALLPTKEHLARSLHARMTSLKAATELSDGLKADPRSILLKECLQQIEQVNQANRVFIENTLVYYEDFLKRFTPVSYGVAESRSFRHDSGFYKGRTFRKEI